MTEIDINIIKLTNDISIRTNDRVSIYGKTGTGKTETFIKLMYPQYPRLVFWDVKRENGNIPHDIMVTNPKDLKKVIDKNNKILYQPKSIETSDFDEVCQIIFEAGNIALYVDEVAAVSSTNKIEYYHKLIMTQGRSKGIGIVNVSQRPKDISNILISESEQFLIFTLTLDPDIKKLENIIGKDVAEEIRFLKYHYFLYYNTRDNIGRLFQPIGLETEGIPELKIYKPSLKEYLQQIEGR